MFETISIISIKAALSKFTLECNRLVLIFIVAFVIILVSGFFGQILAPLFNDKATGYTNSNLLQELFVGVIVAPLLETIISFSIPLFFFREFHLRKLAGIITVAILFGLQHYYSLLYLLNTFVIGLIFGGLYYLSLERRENTFVNLVVVHMLFNLIAISLNRF